MLSVVLHSISRNRHQYFTSKVEQGLDIRSNSHFISKNRDQILSLIFHQQDKGRCRSQCFISSAGLELEVDIAGLHQQDWGQIIHYSCFTLSGTRHRNTILFRVQNWYLQRCFTMLVKLGLGVSPRRLLPHIHMNGLGTYATLTGLDCMYNGLQATQDINRLIFQQTLTIYTKNNVTMKQLVVRTRQKVVIDVRASQQ